MKIVLIIVVIMACILGYGYWHSLKHASFHIQLDFNNESDGTQKSRPRVRIKFLDSKGRVLAHGISDDHYNFVHLIHPEVGDCHEVEQSASVSKSGKNAWQACFEDLSTWIATWVSHVSQIDIKEQQCTWRNIPVTVSKSDSDWLLWWVPHPHIGGKPYTNYSLNITVGSETCANQS